MRHKLSVGLVVGLLAVVLLAVGAGGTERAQVPWVLGNSEAEAVKRIERRDLHAEVLKRAGGAHRLSDRFKVEGQVVFQEYRGGITLPRGSAVRLMVYDDARRRHHDLAGPGSPAAAQAASGRSSSRSRTTTARAGETSSTSPSDSSTKP